MGNPQFLLEDYCLIMERRFVGPNDTETKLVGM
jgi:hypothetical protein